MEIESRIDQWRSDSGNNMTEQMRLTSFTLAF